MVQMRKMKYWDSKILKSNKTLMIEEYTTQETPDFILLKRWKHGCRNSQPYKQEISCHIQINHKTLHLTVYLKEAYVPMRLFWIRFVLRINRLGLLYKTPGPNFSLPSTLKNTANTELLLKCWKNWELHLNIFNSLNLYIFIGLKTLTLRLSIYQIKMTLMLLVPGVIPNKIFYNLDAFILSNHCKII